MKTRTETHPPARRQPGLELCMDREARKMASQHRKLKALRDEIRRSLSSRSLPRAERSFGRFVDVLVAHFSVEERIYFPAVRRSWPHLAANLEDLEQDHARILGQAGSVREAFAGGNGFECAIALDVLLHEVVRHESVEEALMRRVSSARPREERCRLAPDQS